MSSLGESGFFGSLLERGLSRFSARRLPLDLPLAGSDPTIRFGGAIEAAEARMIVERMKARFAFPEMPTVS